MPVGGPSKCRLLFIAEHRRGGMTMLEQGTQCLYLAFIQQNRHMNMTSVVLSTDRARNGTDSGIIIMLVICYIHIYILLYSPRRLAEKVNKNHRITRVVTLQVT
jgi:hypothetical protein